MLHAIQQEHLAMQGLQACSNRVAHGSKA
jgi:hypothetical protein